MKTKKTNCFENSSSYYFCYLMQVIIMMFTFFCVSRIRPQLTYAVMQRSHSGVTILCVIIVENMVSVVIDITSCVKGLLFHIQLNGTFEWGLIIPDTYYYVIRSRRRQRKESTMSFSLFI